MTSCLTPWREKPFQKGSTLEGKNLLLEEQILSYKSSAPWRREAKVKLAELLPLKMYSFTLSLGSRYVGKLII